jgi:hypothetical protein
MTTPTQRSIARLKLGELARQHQHLSEHYRKVHAEAEKATHLRQRFESLRKGLAEATFAQRQLHADVVNLSAVELELEGTTASDSFLASWVSRLERELEQGQRRSECACLFGLLLDEHAPDEPADSSESRAIAEAEAKVVARWSEPERADADGFVQLLGRVASRESRPEIFQNVVANDLLKAVSLDEARGHLLWVSRNPDHAPAVRREAALLLSSETQVNECAGALTILLNDLDRWSWPEKGVPLRTVWSRNTYRTFLDLDLLNLLLLQVLGVRWGVALRPRVTHLFPADPLDQNAGPIHPFRTRNLGEFFFADVPNSTDSFDRFMRDSYAGGNGFGETTLDTFGKLLAVLNGELKLSRALRPNDTTHLLQTDIRLFFPSVGHGLLRTLLFFVGVPEGHLKFFERYLALSFQRDGRAQSVKRGMPMGQVLSHVLGDALLRVLDAAIRSGSGLRTIRFLDDIYLVSSDRNRLQRAWNEATAFFKTCDLEPNLDKTATSSVGVSANASANAKVADSSKEGSIPGVASRPVRWGMLELDFEGRWNPSRAAVDEFVSRWQTRVRRDQPVLSMVREYNAGLGHVLRGLGPLLPLSNDHAERMNLELASVSRRVLGADANKNAIDWVRSLLSKRFADLAPAVSRLPDAWFHWPITAGGLGMNAPSCYLASVRAGSTYTPEPVHPSLYRRSSGGELEDIEESDLVSGEDHEWGHYYSLLVNRRVSVSPPRPTPMMEGLQRDFISRGGEVRGEKQEGLSAYWQWVLYTYGPQLIDSLGTFRFQLTELVPMQLVSPGSVLAGKATADPILTDDDIPF